MLDANKFTCLLLGHSNILDAKQISDFLNIVIVEFTGVDIRGLPWQELFLWKKNLTLGAFHVITGLKCFSKKNCNFGSISRDHWIGI